MRVRIFTSDGGELDVANFDAESALDLVDALNSTGFLTFDMDGATVIVNRDHIVRIDIETGAV